MLEESSSTRVYFGALSFTEPLEKLVLCTISFSILLDWLSKPKGPHLVETTSGSNSEKALAIGVTRRMLYDSESPLVGVELVYKPHYISAGAFSVAYMCLNEWDKAGSQMGSEDRITSSKLLFVNPSESSSTLPMALKHPILLDVADRELLEAGKEPPAPAKLRGFRLHTLWRQQARGELICQVGFPRLFGENSVPLLVTHSKAQRWPLPSNLHPRIIGMWSQISSSPLHRTSLGNGESPNEPPPIPRSRPNQLRYPQVVNPLPREWCPLS